MDAKETQKLLIKPVLNHLNGDFRTIKGNFLIKYPIGDIVTGFCFERSSDKNDFYLNTFSQPLYLLDKIIYLSFGDRIKNKNGIEAWSLIASPRFSADTIEELISALQNNLSFVEKMRSPDNFYSYYEKKYRRSKSWRLTETLIYTAFWLKKPDAKSDAIDLINYIENHDNLTLDWVKQCRDSLQELVDSNDPIAILQKNKEQTIKNLKL